MKDRDYLNDISEIKTMMSRSSRFMSLSGLSGILAGIYAIAAAAYAHFRIAEVSAYTANSNAGKAIGRFLLSYDAIGDLMLAALLTLALALLTGAFLTIKKAKKRNEQLWNPVSKRLLFNFAVPLVAGGLFCLVFLQYEFIGLVAPTTLIFYGLALLNASKFTVGDIKYLGLANLMIGLVATQFIGFGIYFWALGFGIFHIIYGIILYNKYDK
ncbi:hypothetical protein LDL79_12995 [Leeuwenhoekiella palythoae]|uniref:hypothetical protein n=1 Tax=Leeuwenhoekiella palythoae TaxID=573501 RepID=UPI001CE1194E|nr:hypothetical protein [Leeuwenhoekiella palythoae]UBZ09708.1 hypothetical protein LDL79_12995 [Leeuwenhoekiella palythoae]